MKFSIPADVFGKALGLAKTAVSAKTSIPILSHYLLKTEDNGQLRVTASNREIAISVWVEADIQVEGSIALPARLLSEFVAALPRESLAVEVDEKTLSAKLICGRFSANIKGMDPLEFPVTDIGEKKKRTKMSLALDIFKGMIDKTTFAASTDEAKPTLTAASLTFGAMFLSMAATDGYRLGYTYEDIPTNTNADDRFDTNVLVTAKTLNGLSALFKEAQAESNVEIEIIGRSDQISFRFDGKNGIVAIELISGLVDARFPDYKAIIPKSCNTRCIINLAQLSKALRIGKLFANESANILRFKCEPGETDETGKVTLLAANQEMGNNETEIDASVVGPVIEIAFDVRFLIAMIDTFTHPQLVMELTQSTRPGLFYEDGVDQEKHLVVIMPMHPPR